MPENIVEQFDKFLRYYVCGFVFLLTVFYSSGRLSEIIVFHKEFGITAYLFFIPLVSGTIIYTIHRNFLNYFIERLRRSIQNDREWLIREDEWEGMLLRWGVLRVNKEDKEDKKEKALSNIRTWGDHVQLLYSSGLAILLGSTLTKTFDTSGKEYKFSWIICIICLSLYSIGFFADTRKQTAETKLEEM